jgi:hypothetical protein
VDWWKDGASHLVYPKKSAEEPAWSERPLQAKRLEQARLLTAAELGVGGCAWVFDFTLVGRVADEAHGKRHAEDVEEDAGGLPIIGTRLDAIARRASLRQELEVEPGRRARHQRYASTLWISVAARVGDPDGEDAGHRSLSGTAVVNRKQGQLEPIGGAKNRRVNFHPEAGLLTGKIDP